MVFIPSTFFLLAFGWQYMFLHFWEHFTQFYSKLEFKNVTNPVYSSSFQAGFAGCKCVSLFSSWLPEWTEVAINWVKAIFHQAWTFQGHPHSHQATSTAAVKVLEGDRLGHASTVTYPYHEHITQKYATTGTYSIILYLPTWKYKPHERTCNVVKKLFCCPFNQLN